MDLRRFHFSTSWFLTSCTHCCALSSEIYVHFFFVLGCYSESLTSYICPMCCVLLGSSLDGYLNQRSLCTSPAGQVVYARGGLWKDICTNGHWTVVNSNYEPQCSLFLQDRERGTIRNIQFVSFYVHILRLATAAEPCVKALWTSGIEHLLARRCIEHLMTLGVLACSELVVLVHSTYLNFILTSKLGAHGPMGLKFKDVSSHSSYFGSLRSISGNMPSQRRGVLLSLGLDTDTRWLEIFDQPKRIWLVLVSPAKVIGTK